jgi:cellobiose-specific phosphotransferase system component IIC
MSTGTLSWGSTSPWGAYGGEGRILNTIGSGLQNINWQQTGEALSTAAGAGVSIYSSVSAIKAQKAAQQAAAQQLAMQAAMPAPMVSVDTGSALPWAIAGAVTLGALVFFLTRGQKKGSRRKNPGLGSITATTVAAIGAGISTLVGAAKVGYDIRSGKRAERMNQTMTAHQQVQALQTASYQQGAQQAAAQVAAQKQGQGLKALGLAAVLGAVSYLIYKRRSS